ncbi:helix-turn-helix domain-containing protein [Pseudorhodoferax soli]|uniref:AraC family transcriptional regulator n=1 Tax=Pseudorhodoferax soli TaxID=545864 RepID=A0A368XR94_9BURK|nr:AraC family transcriptional regulator [Pseudorhodoferax soli]RCW68534.1 AraC family transcriptional regulator [Pseudorhodoferax soli]
MNHSPSVRRTAAAHGCQASTPLARHVGWGGLPMSLERLPVEQEVAGGVLPHAAIGLIRSGTGKRWLTTAGRTQEFRSAPGLMAMGAAGFRVDHARCAGKVGEVILIQLPSVLVNPLLQDDLPTFELSTCLELIDPSLSHLIGSLWEQAADGLPLGAMYSEGLTLALLGYLSHKYSAGKSGAKNVASKFGSRDRARLESAISENLAGDLRISTLAQTASMSAYHFTRVFKATYGLPVHAYVLDRRIEAASKALRRNPDRSVVEIAADCGFSSQAHFTDVFRKRTGATPARWRRAA